MDFFNILTMIGGLALFLYGMYVLGEGLSKVSGGKMERLLEKLTSSALKAMLLGAGVTAVIQSSSATTVMVVGFVNSGIMKLSQAVGVIMGANIGTTATSWILSMTGIESSNFIVQRLKPTSFSPILAIIGIAFVMFSKNEKKRDIGSVMIGFAILMFGMETMAVAVKPLADMPQFTGILTAFSNPLVGLLAGTVLTAIIQSSSASVGILQALSLTGSINFMTAIPIIMGQNIGTCITAILSSIGTSKNAKRAALVHLYFNVIGTAVFMILFYSANAIFKFSFLSHAASPVGIAIVHSTFNIFATMLLLPFAKGLEKLAYLTIKESPEEKEVCVESAIKLLDPHFLNTPSLAIDQAIKAAEKMADLTKRALFESIELVENFDEEKANSVLKLENRVDNYEDQLGTYLVKLSAQKLSKKDSETLSGLLHGIGDFERISDHSVNIMEAAREMFNKKSQFSDAAKNEFRVFASAVEDIVEQSFSAYINHDETVARQIEPLEEVIDHIHAEVKKRHIKRLRTGECTIEMGFILSDLSTSLERISDHCSNLAVSVIQLSDDEIAMHGYLEALDKKNNEWFQKKYQEYKEIYELPNSKE